MRWALSAYLSISFVTSAVAAPDVVMIVSRGAESIELFWSTKGDRIHQLLGTSTDWMEDGEGHVPFDDLRDGTFEGADVLFERVVVRVDGRPTDFEAMSLMVHPENDALPFVTPLDALISIEVCQIEAPATPPTLGDLQTYAGYFAYKVPGYAEVSVDFPNTGRGALDLVVMDYAEGALVHEHSISLIDGGGITLPAAQPSRGFWRRLFTSN